MLGLYSYGPPLDAAARLLTGEEASRVAGKLAGRYPVQHRFLTRLLHRAWRRQRVHYELVPCDAADGRAVEDAGDECSLPSASGLVHRQVPPWRDIEVVRRT